MTHFYGMFRVKFNLAPIPFLYASSSITPDAIMSPAAHF